MTSKLKCFRNTFDSFHLQLISAKCLRRFGNGHQYELQWKGGGIVRQNLSCIFRKLPVEREFKIGENFPFNNFTVN